MRPLGVNTLTLMYQAAFQTQPSKHRASDAL